MLTRLRKSLISNERVYANIVSECIVDLMFYSVIKVFRAFY